MGTLKAISELLQSIRSDGSRSSALSTLAKVLSVLGVIVLLAIKAGAATWVLGVLLSFVGLFAVVFSGLYVYFALKSPDQLRSERYSLKRMEIERGLVGDDRTGLFEARERIRIDLGADPRGSRTPTGSLPPAKTQAREEDDDAT